MARRRVGERGSSSLIWPGFVDAMTALLLVLMFVLSIFMIVQFVLREELSGKDDALQSLSAQLGALTSQLSLAEQESEYYQAELQSLTGLLDEERQRADALNEALADEAAEREAIAADLQARVLEIAALSSSLTETESRADELTTLVAVLTDERDAAQFALDDQRRRNEAAAEIEQQNVALRQQLIELTAARDAVASELEASRRAASDDLAAAERAMREALAAAEASSDNALETLRRAAAQELDDVRAEAARQLAAVQSELEAAREQLRIVQGRLASAEGVIAERDAAVEDLDAARAAAAQELAATRAELQSARDLLAQAEAELIAARSDIDAARRDVAAREGDLSERDAALAERDALIESVRRRLAEAENRARQSDLTLGEKIAALELALEKKREEAEETLLLLAAAEAKRDELQDAATALERRAADQVATLSQRDVAAAIARAELRGEREVSEQGRRAVALLNAQVRQLRNEIASLRLKLDASEVRDAENQVVIQDLGARLNQALAAKVSELQRYRSEFFGRMRDALGERDDIRVVGDRFVFQSEVLFRTGEAQLGPGGRAQLSRLASAIRDIQGVIPEDVNWILRIDGHTDKVPVSGAGRFQNNWALSQARALSVVEFLIDQERLPPARLAAAGFGEYQPIDLGDSPQSLARNRRIEIRLTER